MVALEEDATIAHHPPHMSSVRAITPRMSFRLWNEKRMVGLYHLPFVVLAMRFFRECYETSGKPYEIALEHLSLIHI